MNALNDFKVFVAAKEILEEYIGMGIDYDVSLNLKDKYSFSDYEIRWQMEDQFVYGDSADLVKEFNDCEMYLVHSCTGDKYIAVFDKSNKVDG